MHSAKDTLVCTVVVNGLNNFQVGMPSVLPNEGSTVDTSSYAVCGTASISVDIGLVVTVECAPSTRLFRYVIVQSLDTEAEKLCLAEVSVYQRPEGECAVTLVLREQHCCCTQRWSYLRRIAISCVRARVHSMHCVCALLADLFT